MHMVKNLEQAKTHTLQTKETNITSFPDSVAPDQRSAQFLSGFQIASYWNSLSMSFGRAMHVSLAFRGVPRI